MLASIEIFNSTDSFTEGDIIDLPCAFRYRKIKPNKRISTKRTSKGAFTQTANPPFIYEGETFRFSMDIADLIETQFFNALFEECVDFYFNGFFGERFLVTISTLELDQICGPFRIRGEMLIKCLENTANFAINCE